MPLGQPFAVTLAASLSYVVRLYLSWTAWADSPSHLRPPGTVLGGPYPESWTYTRQPSKDRLNQRCPGTASQPGVTPDVPAVGISTLEAELGR